MKKRVNTLILITAMLLGQGAVAHGKSILDSKHNLSANGGNEIRATGESEVCIFCHTPHHARQDIPYLWNRRDPVTYTPYKSTTLSATVGQPTGASRLCLSCHDGTIALGAVLSRPTEIPFSLTLAGRSSLLGTDLSDDHPVSFSYQSSITSGNTELVDASALTSPVQLDSTGQLQCTACHDPHNDALGKFLVMTNQYSALCLKCHNKSNWEGSTHDTSDLTWNGTAPDPWPNSTYTTVKENGCGNCHRPHTAGMHQRLLKQINEEDNCLVCHSGNVAITSDIASELTKSYRHSVGNYADVHDAAEDFGPAGVVKGDHVECEDCHNPHQVKNTTAVAPYVSGKNIGVQGITADGVMTQNAQYLYEICFKCHAAATKNVIDVPEIVRYSNQLDTRIEFNYINNDISSSSHPVIQKTGSTYTPSLKAIYRIPNSNMYCTDCHGSDNPTVGAQGPHGSIYPHLLVANYKTQDVGTAYNAFDHELCYKCHDQAIIEGGDLLENGGKAKIFSHGGHLALGGINNDVVSCATCHDPHGSSNYPNLINFNSIEVTGFTTFIPGTTTASPACSLTCHGHIHHIPSGTGGGGNR
ncbi:MAG: cytochrome c3 family protein [Desulfocapsaceae bacterium]|nr:cytochrome c3 family protein [Desulfocapsaceae bacterium]